ncbi:MAG: hypothetical protein AAB320_06220 [Elusimicrobiota bacterium]
MKQRLFLVAFFSLFPSEAQAVHSPDPAAVIKIDSLIQEGNLFQKGNRKANGDPDDVETLEIDIKKAERGTVNGPDPVKIAGQRAHLKELKLKRDRAYWEATKRTLVAYGLVDKNIGDDRPIMPTGTAVYPGFEGRKVQWIVIYKDNMTREVLDNQGNHSTIAPGKMKTGGITASDGVTTIYGQLHSAADLALLLYHEQVHFEQFTTPGLGNKLTYNEREERAYLAQSRALSRFGLSADEMRVSEDFLLGEKGKDGVRRGGKISDFHEMVKSDDRWIKASFGLWRPADPGVSNSHTAGELAAIMKQSKEFETQSRRESDQRHVASIRGLARRICRLESISEQELSDFGYDPDPGFYGQAHRTLLASASPMRGQTCEEDVELDLLETLGKGNRLAGFHVQKWRAKLRKQHFEVLNVLAGVACELPGLPSQAEFDEFAELGHLTSEEYAEERDKNLTAGGYGQPCRDRAYHHLLDRFASGWTKIAASQFHNEAKNFWEQEGLDLLSRDAASFALIELVKKACANSGGITEADLKTVWWFPNHQVHLPHEAARQAPGCQKEFYLDLYFRNSYYSRGVKINLAWINWRAHQLEAWYRPRPVAPESPASAQPSGEGGPAISSDPGPSREPRSRGGQDFRDAKRVIEKLRYFQFPR